MQFRERGLQFRERGLQVMEIGLQFRDRGLQFREWGFFLTLNLCNSSCQLFGAGLPRYTWASA